MTDWQARYEEGDTPWDKGKAAPPLDEIDAAYFGGRVLAPGCGFGYDVRRIARADNEVIGLDLALAAIAGAREFPRVAGESYVQGDFFALPGDWAGTFDSVLEHTCFCAIDPADRRRYLAAVRGALKPGGVLVAIFYLDPGGDDGPPFPVSEEELDALFDPHFELRHKWVPQVAYAGREGREQVRIYQRRLPAGT